MLTAEQRERRRAREVDIRGLLKRTEEAQERWGYDPPLGLPEHEADFLAFTDHLTAMEGLLREMEWQGETFDVGRKFLVCLYCGGYKDRGGHEPGCRIAALLGSDAAEVKGE